MTSYPISWHEEGNKNFRIFIDSNIKQLNDLSSRIKKDEEKWAFRERQIQEAIKLGKESFDGEKFLIKKNKKITQEM